MKADGEPALANKWGQLPKVLTYGWTNQEVLHQHCTVSFKVTDTATGGSRCGELTEGKPSKLTGLRFKEYCKEKATIDVGLMARTYLTQPNESYRVYLI